MFKTFEQFVEDASSHLEMSSGFVAKHRLRDSVVVDHICYKSASSHEFDYLRKLMECDPPSSHLHQVFLSGRRVAYFSLRVGLPVRGCGAVRYIELCDKKPMQEERAGFHHVEIYPSTMPYETLLKQLHDDGVHAVLKRRPHHTTHDLVLPSGLVIRLTDKPLIKTIVTRESAL
jgi:hypothetical protein